MLNWIRKHKFQTHLTAFLLMITSSVGMHYSLHTGNHNLTWLLIGVFAIANVLAIMVK